MTFAPMGPAPRPAALEGSLEERIEALEASDLALWRLIEEMAEPDVTPKLERAHQALVARIKAGRTA